MSEDEYMTRDEYEQELAIMVALTRVETKQEIANKAFETHSKEDRVHFDRLYDSTEEILAKLAEIPASSLRRAEEIKDALMEESRKEFTTITAFKVFETKVTYIIIGVTVAGTILGSALDWLLQSGKLLAG